METKLKTLTEIYRPKVFEDIIDVNGQVGKIHQSQTASVVQKRH